MSICPEPIDRSRAQRRYYPEVWSCVAHELGRIADLESTGAGPRRGAGSAGILGIAWPTGRGQG